MTVEFEASSVEQNTSEKISGNFCDISKILNLDFTEENEYKNILEELNILKSFQGKSEKRIILLRHFEDDKENTINGKITEKGLNNGEEKSLILDKYLKNSKTLIRYAGLGKNREIVNRTSETAELLINNLSNVSGIVQEDGLDSTYKNDDKKTKNLVVQEVKTVDFLERFKKEQNKELSKTPEIWIVHKTNMDKILREVLDILPEDKAFYGALDFGETAEFDMGFNEEQKIDFLKQNNNFIKLTNTNYLDIILELEESENIPENIKKAINYFRDGKIKIIDLQNVINKNILENNVFLEQFKNSENIDLRKLSFINILENNDLLDDEIEKLIIEDNLDDEIIKLINYLSEIFEDYNKDINYSMLSTIYSDFDNNKNKFLRFVKIIGVINSRQIISLKYLDELEKFYDFIKLKEENNDFSKTDELIKNSNIKNGFSNIFKDYLPEFRKYLKLKDNGEEKIFIINLKTYNSGFEQGIDGSIKLSEILENGEYRKINLYGNMPWNLKLQIHDDFNSERFKGFFENKTEFNIINIVEKYIKENVKIEESHMTFPYYIILKFNGKKLVLEKGNTIYRNTELNDSEFIELEELLQDGIFKGKITEEFKEFYNIHKSKEWFNRHIENIIGLEIKDIYLQILDLVRKVNKNIDDYYKYNPISNYNFNREILTEKSEEFKKLINKNDLKKLKKDFSSKIDFYNKLILQYIYPDYVESDIFKIETIENIKGILEYIKD